MCATAAEQALDTIPVAWSCRFSSRTWQGLSVTVTEGPTELPVLQKTDEGRS
ncbi:hypothetical protein [Streptomyces sp. NPDC059564]|uniref:hypothetical protein n=1 Tax=Streptomyces sp. NPDC059564 TaxID=3346865 RepID=UPI0036A439C3